ncbi:MAG: hypothetical protein LRY31_00330, partial [Burkholderiaceae bacterium]|nr:hypothetical protein [Burkholderiaceae bacterium]
FGKLSTAAGPIASDISRSENIGGPRCQIDANSCCGATQPPRLHSSACRGGSFGIKCGSHGPDDLVLRVKKGPAFFENLWQGFAQLVADGPVFLTQ